MCKINVKALKEQVDAMASAIVKEESTKFKVIEQLTAKAAELHAAADVLTMLANNLRNGLSDTEPAGRRVVVLKEGERHPKAQKPKSEKKSKKIISEERMRQLQEQCRMMRERKTKQALVDKFAETKIS